VSLLERLPASLSLRLLLEAAVLVVAYLAYQLVRHAVAPRPTEAFEHALALIHIEQRLGIFFEPSLQRFIIDHHALVTLFNWIYVWGFLPVICTAAVYLFVRHRGFYSRYRNAFLLSGAAGLLVFAFLPVAPPRMFPEFGFVDTVHVHSTFYRSVQASELVNEFAAVPSFHFGWMLLVGMAVVQTSSRLAGKAVGVLLPVVMLLAIIFTANHYVLDAVAGAALVLAALGVVLAAERAYAALLERRLVPALVRT
jgi:hypothetical protein